MFLSILYWVLGAFAVLAMTLAYTLVLKPWQGLQMYKKPGFIFKFFPMLGTWKVGFDSVQTHGDFYTYLKQQITLNPKMKAVATNFFNKPLLILVDTGLIKDFFQKQKYYAKTPILNDLLKILFGEGLVSAPLEIWKKHRRVISSSFHFNCLQEMIPSVVSITNQAFSNLKNKDLSNADVMHEFEKITGDVVGRLFFGENFSEYKIQGKPVTEFIAEFNIRVAYEFSSPLYMLFGARGIRSKILPRHKKLMNDREEFYNFARNIIEKRIEERKSQAEQAKNKTRKTFIDSLLDTSDKSAQDIFSIEEIIDEFMTFFIAGMDTTGHWVTMALYYLSQNPQYKDKLLEEINAHFNDSCDVNIDSLNQMNFMTAFLKETLRVATPATFIGDRVALEDHELNGVPIKKGTFVQVNLLINNYNPDYHQDPMTFDPYRWLQDDSKTKQSVAKDPYVFVPFSSGPNNCIGQHLAMNEARVIFSLFLKKFKYELAPEYDHKMTVRLLYEPDQRLMYKLKPLE